jgi:hypothetical protein
MAAIRSRHADASMASPLPRRARYCDAAKGTATPATLLFPASECMFET